MSMLPSFNDLSYFFEVSETKNISRAAERLGITQPSLSSAIKRLEDSLGAQLLVRSRTGVQLTKAGVQLAAKGRLFLLNWEQLKSEVNRREQSVAGEYVLGCHPSVALYTLPHFLPGLVQDYPEIEVKLVHDLSRKITEGVISFAIDFGIVVNPVKHPDLVIKELYTDSVCFWTAKKPSPTQKVDSGEAVLICDPNLTQVQKLLGELQKKKINFKRTIYSPNLEVITEMVMSGVGVGILPTRVATRHSSFELQVLEKQFPQFKDRICLVYRGDSQKTKGHSVILESIKNSSQSAPPIK